MSDGDAKIIELPRLPLHAVDGGGTRGRGRPPKVEAKPDRDDLVYHAESLAERARVVEADEIVQAASKGSEPQEVLRLVIEALAADAAALGHARDELAKRGRQSELGQLTTRRAALLDKIAALTIELSNLGVGVLDMHSEPVQKAFGMLVENVLESAREVMKNHPALMDLFFDNLARQLDGWEDRVEDALR